jgi:hypothetical protein
VSKKAEQINVALMFKKGPLYVAEKTNNGDDKIAALSFLMALLEKQKVFLGLIVETVFLLTEKNEEEDALVTNMTKAAVDSVAQHLNQLVAYFSKGISGLQKEAIAAVGLEDESGATIAAPNYAKIPEYFLKCVLASVNEMQADLLKLGTADPMSPIDLTAIRELRVKLLGSEYSLDQEGEQKQEAVLPVVKPKPREPRREAPLPAVKTVREREDEDGTEDMEDEPGALSASTLIFPPAT